MNEKKALVIILILALALRLAFAFAVPVFDKPDEKPHFEYIKYVAENKNLPIQESQGGEFFQPPLYHVFASFIFALASIFTDNEYYIVLILRLLSVIASMLTLFFIYKLSSLLFKNKSLVLGIVAFASFLPSHISISSTITNANFADLLTTMILYLLLRVIMGKTGNKMILLLGLLSGIAMLTRLSLIPVLLAVPLAFIIKYYPNIKANLRNIIKPVAIIAIIALAMSSWNLIRNYEIYGDPLGISAMHISSPQDEISVDASFAGRLLGWTFVTFWAAFGRTNGIFLGNLDSAAGILLFSLSYLLLLIVTLCSVYGLFRFIKKCMKDRKLLDDIQKKYSIIALFHLLLLLLLFVRFNFYDFQPQGRLFFPAISTIAILFTFGIYSIFNEKRWEKLFNIYAVFLVLLSVVSFANILAYYY